MSERAAARAFARHWFYDGSPDSTSTAMLETSLYHPVKAYLESLGFAVKGEIGGFDVVALSPDAPPFLVICEMKLQFSLELVLQGVDRACACDEVWLAAQLSRRGKGREADPRFRALCRRLGFGMLGISEAGQVQVLLSPIALAPRRDPRRRSRLLDEHNRRRGDPVAGGGSRQPIMTAYRQEALACAAAMSGDHKRPAELKTISNRAPSILRRNVYGWFERVGQGIYGLTSAGQAALERWPQDHR